MINRKLIIALSLAAGISANPGPALGFYADEVYNIRYYSDATYTVQVGMDYGDCFYFGPGYRAHEGQSTQYAQYEHIGYCINGQWQPL